MSSTEFQDAFQEQNFSDAFCEEQPSCATFSAWRPDPPQEIKLSLEGIQHFHVSLGEESWKFATLLDLYESTSAALAADFKCCQAVLLCPDRQKVEWLANQLRERRLIVSVVDGDMDQKTVDAAVQDFNHGSDCGQSRILVATNLDRASGLSAKKVSMIFVYSMMDEPSDYLKQVGHFWHSPQSKNKVVAISFVLNDCGDDVRLQNIQIRNGIEIPHLPSNVPQLLLESG